MIAPPLTMALVNADGGNYNLVLYVFSAIMFLFMLVFAIAVSKGSRNKIKAADQAWQADNAKD